MEAATLTMRSQWCRAVAAPAHGAHRRAAATVPRFGAQRHRRTPCRRLRALPPELSEILSPKLVPGSPADTGDVSSLIPIRTESYDREHIQKMQQESEPVLSAPYTQNTYDILSPYLNAVMLLFYFVSNWVVPEMLMKGLKQQPKPEEDEAAAAAAASAASMSPPRQQGDIVDGQTDSTGASRGKIRLKVKTRRNRKADMKV